MQIVNIIICIIKLYTVLAMIWGVFYRELTKINDYTGLTTLPVAHARYFVFGTMFFLLLGVVSTCGHFKSNRQCCYMMPD